MGTISVALVDDHPILLAGVAGILANSGQFTIVAQGKCADDALSIVRTACPDVLVIDLNMPGNSLESISTISKQSTGTKVVAFTASTAIDHAVGVLEAGASGYILKGSSADELIAGIEAVHAGETFISQGFASKVIAALRDASAREAAERNRKLSYREEQIVRLLLRGRTNREIAVGLGISEKTVKHYMTVLMQKLQVRNRLEVVIAAQRLASAAAPREPDPVPVRH